MLGRLVSFFLLPPFFKHFFHNGPFREKIFRNALAYQRVDELEDGEDEILESEDLTIGVDSLRNIEKLDSKSTEDSVN
jgi:hypothetical protein